MTACGGTCQSCALTGTVGTCTNVPNGADPLNQCSDLGAAACSTDGSCNGSGACRLYAAGTQCVAATCTGTTFTPARTCNGARIQQTTPPGSHWGYQLLVSRLSPKKKLGNLPRPP